MTLRNAWNNYANDPSTLNLLQLLRSGRRSYVTGKSPQDAFMQIIDLVEEELEEIVRIEEA